MVTRNQILTWHELNGLAGRRFARELVIAARLMDEQWAAMPPDTKYAKYVRREHE